MKKKVGSKPLLLSTVALIPGVAQAQKSQADKPNIVIINIDDMGYSDPWCFGGDYAPTPNIDKMAEEGLSLRQFYTSCPISSPSRVGLTTGMYPTRWGINTFLQERAGNARNEQNDFLNSDAPSMARALKEGGYVTGHFGKWHMGGGRDVKNAPAIPKYGFDEYSSTWESPDPDPKLTSSNWIWAATDEVKRWDRTAYFVDRTLDFLSRHKGEPCFVNLWPDDVHTPWVYENDEASQRESSASFAIVLAELDRQIGRFMQGLKDLGIDDNTIVIFTGDNGPAPAFDGHRTNSFRGQKGTLYEGGIRMPFIIRWPGVIDASQVNTTSVVCMVDLFPSLCSIAGVDVPTKYPLDGKDMSEVLLGNSTAERQTPLFWEFGKTKGDRISPHIGVREGDWKLLVNADGSNTELYNMATDYNEQHNVAFENPAITERLKKAAIDWFNESYRQYADHVIYVSADGDAAADGSSWDSATTLENGVALGHDVSGSQLWLKKGVYEVSSSINADNLKFYGGFAGTEKKLGERDWSENLTIIDGGGTVSPFRNSNLDATVSTVIDGVVVQNGINQPNANGNGNGGGAILTNGAVVRNCVFRNNRTQNKKNGAAIHCHAGSVTIENCLFVNNTSSGNGGGIQVGGGVTANVINSTFANNKSDGPGGAFGLGLDTSNLNLYNTIAYKNTGNGKRSSYGQNTNVNGGGKVVSKYSAVESESKKFTDGDDVNHMVLTESNTPGFVAPAQTEGYVSDPEQAEEAFSASYLLTEDSPCVDSGNINLTSKLDYDLGHQRRLSGKQIDMGAYEFDNGAPSEEAAVIHVSADGNGDADGNSWANATTLEHAVSMAESAVGNTVLWLKAGIYTVGKSVNIDKLEVYGGFDGTETELADRNWAENHTVIDGGGKVSPFRNGNLDVAVTSVLDGLIVQNGINQPNANGNGNGGAAILANGAVVRNCVFRNNRTQNGKNGAAIHCHLGQIRIENSLFVNNTSSGNGGAVQVGGGVTATVINCTFANNVSSGPGGAFGLGNNTSNINIYNSIAYHNKGNGKFSSYGQNSDVNGGGTVISKYSAIESESTKFADGNDEAHMVLSESVAPGFSSPASVYGYTDNADEVSEIENASYALGANSPCIDAGDDNYAAVSAYDLACRKRIQGVRVDMGAYETAEGSYVAVVPSWENRGAVTYKEGNIVVSDAPDYSVLSVYSPDGTLQFRQRGISDSYSLPWKSVGVIVVTLNDTPFKINAN